MDEEGIGSLNVVAASFAVTLTMCVTVKANALKEERVRGRDVHADLQTGFFMSYSHQLVTRTRILKVDVQGPYMSVQFLSARRCTLKAGPPLEAILVIFGRRALIFF